MYAINSSSRHSAHFFSLVRTFSRSTQQAAPYFRTRILLFFSPHPPSHWRGRNTRSVEAAAPAVRTFLDERTLSQVPSTHAGCALVPHSRPVAEYRNFADFYFFYIFFYYCILFFSSSARGDDRRTCGYGRVGNELPVPIVACASSG